MVVSPLKDSLKLLFSDEYNISDSDYQALSEILVSNNISEDAFSGGVVQLVKLLYDNQVKLPVSLNYLQEVWSTSNMPIPLVKVIAPSIRKGTIKVRRVGKDMFFKHKTIVRASVEPEQKKYIVVYSTDVLDSLYNGFSSILSKYKKKVVSYILTESVSIIPKKVSHFVDKANKLLSVYNITIDIESYMKDLANNLEEINLIVSGTSKYKLTNKDIQKRTKGLRNVKCIHGIETYKESSSELFIGLTTSIETNYSDIPLQLFTFIEDLEVNGV